MIVDTESNLNIYIDMAREGEEDNEEAAGCCGSSATGTASGTVQETSCSSEKATNCYSKTSIQTSMSEHAGNVPTSEVEEVSGGSERHLKTHGGVAASWSLADIDINEWAGKFLCSSHYLAHIYQDRSKSLPLRHELG